MDRLSKSKIDNLRTWLRSTRACLIDLLDSAEASAGEIERLLKLETSIVTEIRLLQDQPSAPEAR